MLFVILWTLILTLLFIGFVVYANKDWVKQISFDNLIKKWYNIYIVKNK